MFFSAITLYFLYLLVLIIKAYSDLRNMPFFGKFYSIRAKVTSITYFNFIEFTPL